MENRIAKIWKKQGNLSRWFLLPRAIKADSNPFAQEEQYTWHVYQMTRCNLSITTRSKLNDVTGHTQHTGVPPKIATPFLLKCYCSMNMKSQFCQQFTQVFKFNSMCNFFFTKIMVHNISKCMNYECSSTLLHFGDLGSFFFRDFIRVCLGNIIYNIPSFPKITTHCMSSKKAF